MGVCVHASERASVCVCVQPQGTKIYQPICVTGVRGDTMEEEIVDVKCELAESLSSHQYKTFIVDLLHKLWTNTQVQLGTWLSCI